MMGRLGHHKHLAINFFNLWYAARGTNIIHWRRDQDIYNLFEINVKSSSRTKVSDRFVEFICSYYYCALSPNSSSRIYIVRRSQVNKKKIMASGSDGMLAVQPSKRFPPRYLLRAAPYYIMLVCHRRAQSRRKRGKTEKALQPQWRFIVVERHE